MDQKSLIQTLSKVKKYTKDLKQVPNNHIQHLSETALSHDNNYYELPHSYTSSSAFHKTKSKVQSMVLLKETSPMHGRTRQPSRQIQQFTMSAKYPTLKKQVQSENERDNTNFNKSQKGIQIKHLSNILNGSMDSRQINVNNTKKPGHSHTYTHLNDIDSDKLSEIDNSFSMKLKKPTKFRHSKSPSKERHIQHNNTSYAQQNYRVNHMNKIHMQRPISQKKANQYEIASLLTEIYRLQSIITQYKEVLMQVKHKYFMIEEQMREKMINDHLMDVLKQKIDDMQDRNNSLNALLHQQTTIIRTYETTFIDKIAKINQYYSKQIQQNVMLKKQNQLLKEILIIARQNPQNKSNCKNIEPTKDDAISPYLRSMTRSVEQFCSKWT